MSDFTGSDAELNGILSAIDSLGTPVSEDEDVLSDFRAWRDAAVEAEAKRLRAETP